MKMIPPIPGGRKDTVSAQSCFSNFTKALSATRAKPHPQRRTKILLYPFQQAAAAPGVCSIFRQHPFFPSSPSPWHFQRLGWEC